MSGNDFQTLMFTLNRPEPVRQSSLLIVLAMGVGDTTSLSNGLKSLAAESGSPWQQRVTHLRTCLEQGQRLSEALMAVNGLLPDQTRIAIKVAEETGTLQQVLTDEAHRLMQLQTTGSARSSVAALITWGLIVGSLGWFLLTFIMVFITPKLLKIFADFDTELPRHTQYLIGYSGWLGDYWYYTLLPVITIAALIGIVAVRAGIQHLATGTVPLSQHYPRYWTPIILRMLSLSVVTKTPLDTCLRAIIRQLRSGRATERLESCRIRAANGDDCWTALAAYRFLNAREVAFLKSADRSQHLDWGLIHLARKIERQRTQFASRALCLVQPAVVLTVGAVVGFICVALFFPLVHLITDIPRWEHM